MAQWYPEIRHHMPHVPFIVVGTKMDLRNNEEVCSRLRAEGKSPLTTADGQRLATELGALGYLECSALTQQGLKTVFDSAIKGALEADKPSGKKKGNGKCAIM
jgi:GTPase SAR1 family protein